MASSLVLGLLALAGCRSSGHSAAPAETRPAAKIGPDEPTTALPADFDKTLPVFPGAMVEHVRRPQGAMREILMSASTSFGKLIDFYKRSLNGGGYQITSTLKSAPRRTWSCEFHKAGRQAGILLYPSDKDKSRMTIDFIYEMPSRSNGRPTAPDEQFDVIGSGEVAQQTHKPERKEELNTWHY